MFNLLTENFISQMAVFWTRPMWDVSRGLDPTKHLDMDYDLWLRFAGTIPPVVIENELADFRVQPQAKGSRFFAAQLRAAWRTARAHAGHLGWRGTWALGLHRLLQIRTFVSYLVVKPRVFRPQKSPSLAWPQGSRP